MADHPEGKFLGEPPLDESTVTDPGRAVFLSYASQDAQAAQKICEALRAGGIEVSSIGANCGAGCVGSEDPHQIHDCALFMPVVSQHTSGAARRGLFPTRVETRGRSLAFDGDRAAVLGTGRR